MQRTSHLVAHFKAVTCGRTAYLLTYYFGEVPYLLKHAHIHKSSSLADAVIQNNTL